MSLTPRDTTSHARVVIFFGYVVTAGVTDQSPGSAHVLELLSSTRGATVSARRSSRIQFSLLTPVFHPAHLHRPWPFEVRPLRSGLEFSSCGKTLIWVG